MVPGVKQNVDWFRKRATPVIDFEDGRRQWALAGEVRKIAGAFTLSESLRML